MSDYDWNKIQTLVEEVQYYISFENTSMTEALECLCGAVLRPDYISQEALDAILKELEGALEMYKRDTKIVKREETFTHTVTELEWL